MMKTAALVFLAGWHLGAAQDRDLDVCGPASNADYQYEVIPTDGFTIRWGIDTGNESISFQVVSAAAAWAGIGFSPDGMMVGSDAVVGLPDEASVLEYDLLGQSDYAVIPSDVQDITSGSVSQDASGETTLTFTRPLSPGGDKQTISSTPGDTAIFIYSYGTDNTLAYHGPEPNLGSVFVDPFCGDAGVSDGTPAPVEAGGGGETPAPSPAVGGGEGRDFLTAAPTALDGGGGGGGRGEETAAPTAMGGGEGRGTTAAPTPTPEDGDRGVDILTAAPTTAGGGGGGGGGGGEETAAPTTSRGGEETGIPATPAPTPEDGERGGDVVTTAPTVDPGAVGTTGAPTSEGDGQGDSDGAFRVGGGGWVVMVTTGVVMVAGMLAL